MTDLETVQRIYRAERNKAAKDTACKLGAAIIVGGFWMLIVSLCILELAR